MHRRPQLLVPLLAVAACYGVDKTTFILDELRAAKVRRPANGVLLPPH
jgi:hypothetical protein